MIVKKNAFIIQFLINTIYRTLEKELPEEDYESDMLEKTRDIIKRNLQ